MGCEKSQGPPIANRLYNQAPLPSVFSITVYLNYIFLLSFAIFPIFIDIPSLCYPEPNICYPNTWPVKNGLKLHNLIALYPTVPDIQYCPSTRYGWQHQGCFLDLTSSLIRCIWPLPRPLTSHPSSKNFLIIASSSIPKQSMMAAGEPIIFTTASGLRFR
jgi:hypothetical protein